MRALATVNPRLKPLRSQTDRRASVVPEMTAVSNPKRRPPSAAMTVLRARAPVSLGEFATSVEVVKVRGLYCRVGRSEALDEGHDLIDGDVLDHLDQAAGPTDGDAKDPLCGAQAELQGQAVLVATARTATDFLDGGPDGGLHLHP